MDTLDARIIRAMLESRATSPLDFSLKKSLNSLARPLKVDENTVKNRIKRLYDCGFLRGWRLILNPNLVGQKKVRIWFDVKELSSKREVIEKMALINGVDVVKNDFGSWLGATFYHEGDQGLKKTCELISRIASSHEIILANEPYPRCNLTPSKEDFLIIRAFQRNPMKSYEVAKELGFSPQTIKRRMTKLSEEEALFMVGELDPRFVSGGIIGSLLVFYDKPEHRSGVTRKLLDFIEDRLLFAELDDTQHGTFEFLIANLSQASEMLKTALALPGVTNGRIDLTEEVFYHPEIYEEQLERLERIQLGKSENPSPASSARSKIVA